MTDDQTLLELAGRASKLPWTIKTGSETVVRDANGFALMLEDECGSEVFDELDAIFLVPACNEVPRLISEKRSEAARADLTGFMLAWVVAVAERDASANAGKKLNDFVGSAILETALRIPVELDEAQAPQPSRPIEPVTTETVCRVGDRLRAKEASVSEEVANFQVGDWVTIRKICSDGSPTLTIDPPEDDEEDCGWDTEFFFDRIERAPQ